MLAIRGATNITENSVKDIKDYSIELVSEIIKQNHISLQSISTMIFSCTKDITKGYPGKYIREHFKLDNAAIMHFNEMDVEDSLELCIRVLILINDDNCKKAKYIYLHDTKNLRNDITQPFGN
jgi:chorismate mutase